MISKKAAGKQELGFYEVASSILTRLALVLGSLSGHKIPIGIIRLA